ncbi:MAG: hypothetical protein AAB067_01460 [Planctomycetota bacterium]
MSKCNIPRSFVKFSVGESEVAYYRALSSSFIMKVRINRMNQIYFRFSREIGLPGKHLGVYSKLRVLLSNLHFQPINLFI